MKIFILFLCCIVLVFHATGDFDYGCPCGERDISEEEVRECKQSSHIEHQNSDGDKRIVNGCDAAHTPWFVKLTLKSGTAPFYCGGSLINKFWVISAAHCICNHKFPCNFQKGNMSIDYDFKTIITLSVGKDGKNANDNSDFSPAEILLHPKYNNDVKGSNGKIYKRQDYDFSLIRLDYPILDEEYGLGVLGVGTTFSKSTVMPICLPSPTFKDTLVKGMVAGIGLFRTQYNVVCISNGFGPDVFMQCASKWLNPDQQIERDIDSATINYGLQTGSDQYQCSREPPPSALEPMCNELYTQIKTLKRKQLNNATLSTDDLTMLATYLITEESLLLPSQEMKIRLDNKTVCFSTEPSEYGWCATCNSSAAPGEPGYCSGDSNYVSTSSEIARPRLTKGWGFCEKNCGEGAFNGDKLKMAHISVFSDEWCKELGIRKEKNMTISSINNFSELCAGFVQSLNTTYVKYTDETNEGRKFNILDQHLRENISRELGGSIRLQNSNLGTFSNRTKVVIGGVDSCKGDSGGPLWTLGNVSDHNNVTKQNVAVLIGIVSRGRHCAYQNTVGAYGRVKRVLNWIRYHADKPQNYTIKPISGISQGRKGVLLKQDKANYTISPFCRNIVEITKKRTTQKPKKKLRKKKKIRKHSKSSEEE